MGRHIKAVSEVCQVWHMQRAHQQCLGERCFRNRCNHSCLLCSCTGTILALHMSCGKLLFLQHWQRISCGISNSMLLQHLIRSEGNPIMAWSLNQESDCQWPCPAYLALALALHLVVHGRQTLDVIDSITDNTFLHGLKLSVVFYPSVQLFVPVCDHFPTGGFVGCSFTPSGTKSFLDAIIHFLMLPVSVVIWMFSLSSCQYSLARHQVARWALLLSTLAAFLRQFLNVGHKCKGCCMVIAEG